jgi:hypothetical protein
MKAFVVGTIVGGLAVWRWREDIARYLDQGREGVVEALDKTRQQADSVIDRAKQTIDSGARTRLSTHSAGSAGGSSPSQGGPGAALGQPAKP